MRVCESESEGVGGRESTGILAEKRKYPNNKLPLTSSGSLSRTCFFTATAAS